MPNKCKKNEEQSRDCCQVLHLDETNGNLTIGPYGNTINICEVVKTCETQTYLYNVRLVGNILEITYIGEDAVPQVKTVDFTDLFTGGVDPITVDDTNSVDLSLISNVLTANIKIDSNSTAPISVSSDGIRIDCCPETLLSATDSNTIDFTLSGTNNHTITASLRYADSATIDFSESGSGLTAGARISTDITNILTSDSSGLLVSSSSLLSLISATAPILYNNSTGVISITQSSGSTDGYLSSTDWTTFNNKVSNGTNLGSSGARVFAQKTGTNLEFRRLVAGTDISITENTNDITITSTASINQQVIYLATLSDLTTYTGLADAIIVGDTEDTYIRYTGSESSDGHYIVTDGSTNQWKILNIDSSTYASDGVFVIPSDKFVEKLVIMPSAGLAGFKVGSSSGADDIVFTQVVTGSTATVFVINQFASGAPKTLYIGGITASTVIRFYKT